MKPMSLTVTNTVTRDYLPKTCCSSQLWQGGAGSLEFLRSSSDWAIPKEHGTSPSLFSHTQSAAPAAQPRSGCSGSGKGASVPRGGLWPCHHQCGCCHPPCGSLPCLPHLDVLHTAGPVRAPEGNVPFQPRPFRGRLNQWILDYRKIILFVFIIITTLMIY